ncbi:MAG: hypothetical protein V4637_03600 [Pseudomonadota bacterium]
MAMFADATWGFQPTMKWGDCTGETRKHPGRRKRLANAGASFNIRTAENRHANNDFGE